MSKGRLNNAVLHAVDQNYYSRKRFKSLIWSIINGGLFITFAYDLSCKCYDYFTALHYVEFVLMTIFGINLLHHGFLLASTRNLLDITSHHKRLLGLFSSGKDASFQVVDRSMMDSSDEGFSMNSENLSVSLSSARSWRSRGSSSPLSSPSPPRHWVSAKSLDRSLDESMPYDRAVPHEFIADQQSLLDYLKQYKDRQYEEQTLHVNSPSQWNASSAPPLYQLACTETDPSLDDTSPQNSPQVWWRLHLDPERLTQFNLNLRLWISKTILERIVREIEVIEDTLIKQGLSDIRIGQVSVERLRQTATSGVAGSLPTLINFLEPFPDQRYVVQRIKDLCQGGCLSNYKWNGGGSGWDEARPTDSELLMSLVASYLDGQLPGASAGGSTRPFSERHVSAAPARPARRADTLLLHRVQRHPPHYVLIMGEETLEVARGRNNFLHTLLLFIAAAVRPATSASPSAPPVLQRVHLGPAGLNMLWIIGL